MKHNYNLVLLHTRAQTVGDYKYNYNNHPIIDEENNNVLVHNGGINNHLELRKKYSIKGIADVDSEVILAMFNLRNQNIETALKELRGRMAIALYNDRKLYLYSNSNPLEITYFKDANLWIFSSEEEYIKSSVSKKEQYHEVFEFDERIDGYGTYSNYPFKDKDFMEISFDNPKKTHLKFKKDVESLDYWESGIRSSRNNLNKENTAMSRLFSGNCDDGRNSLVKCEETCGKCLVKEFACPDRNTKNGLTCRDVITKDMIKYATSDFALVKNMGFKRTAIFDIDDIKECLVQATEEEIALQQ